jgi:3-hydroxy-9,10-secoandrosta-1,3,5(10)-triene-9,17-dione monooxygenase reductase component
MSVATDPKSFRRVLGRYPTGVCVITAMQADGKPVGMAVGSFSSVSLDPSLVAFFPDRSSTSWPKIETAGRFCANILAEHQEPLCRAFSSQTESKFAGISHRLSGNGAPILDDVVAWIDCDLHAVHEAGDHFIVLSEVRALDVERPHKPLLFFQGGYGQFSPLAAV